MKRIILCEGRTDAILLSYFLEKRFGWSYFAPAKGEVPHLPVDPDNEELNWYRRRDKMHTRTSERGEVLAIWGVGGITKLPQKLQNVVDYSRTVPQSSNEDRFSHIVLFLDHDDPLDIIRSKVTTWVKASGLRFSTEALQIGQWMPTEMDLVGVTPARTYASKLLVIVVPPDRQGALERFLIECWKQFSEADKQLAQAAQIYIEELPSSPKEKYLHHRRLRDKACLSSIFSVVSPDRVFEKIHPRLREVPWNKLTDMLDVYEELGAL